MSTSQQVIEFELGGDRYCVDVTLVSEVVRVDRDEVTVLPDSPRYVEGIVNLRGSSVKVIDPRLLLNIETESAAADQMLVFDEAEFGDGQVGWLIEEVYQVSDMDADVVEEGPSRSEAIRGVVNREDGFVIWASPERALG